MRVRVVMHSFTRINLFTIETEEGTELLVKLCFISVQQTNNKITIADDQIL